MKYGQKCRTALARRLRQVAEVLESDELDNLMEEIFRKVKTAAQAAGVEQLTASMEAVSLGEIEVAFGDLDRGIVIDALTAYTGDDASPVWVIPMSGEHPFPVRIILHRMIK